VTTTGPPTAEGELARDALLATGRTVHIRTAASGDVAGLRDFYDRLSPTSAHSRFFGIGPHVPDRLLEATTVFDVHRHVALLAESDGRIVGVGEYHACPGGHDAEVAFAVTDAHQHEGIATLLLGDLAAIARAAGIQRFLADTLSGNWAMQSVFRDVGLPCRTHREAGTVTVELSLVG
jgi:GNAT superfamily N-acetyltransferase